MDDTAREAVAEQAALWALRYEQGLSHLDLQRLHTWLAQDANHLSSFQQMCQLSEVLGQFSPKQLTQLDVSIAAELMQTAPDGKHAQHCNQTVNIANHRVNDTVKPRTGTYHFWPIAACALLTLAGILGWQNRPFSSDPTEDFNQTYQSAWGQIRHIALPDGSQIDLDSDSQIQVQITANTRQVTLAKGQAMFDVAHDPKKPFQIHNSQSLVTVLGTQFSVRDLDNTVQVAVQSGTVKVQTMQQQHIRTDAAHHTLLTAGQSVQITQYELSAIKPISTRFVGSWRQGRLIFENTPLKQVLKEFARYNKLDWQLTDASLSELELTGSFEITNLQQFEQLLPQVLPVEVSHLADNRLVIARKSAL